MQKYTFPMFIKTADEELERIGLKIDIRHYDHTQERYIRTAIILSSTYVG